MAHFTVKSSVWERKDLYYPTVGEDLDILKQDQLIRSDPNDNKRRRTIVIKRQHVGNNLPSFGFTLQSYGLLDRKAHNFQLLSYVDYVEIDGPAHIAGLRPGDVILSVNGVSMENADHQTLVNYIKSAQHTLRLIVLFEDCCRKIELHMRRIKLQHVLAEKIRQLRELEAQEANLLSGRSINNTPTNCGSDSENSLLSYYSAEQLCSPENDVFRASSASLSLPVGSANASFHSLDSGMPPAARKLFTFPSQNGISSVSDDDVFSRAAPTDQYECSSLPIKLMKKKKLTLRNHPLNCSNASEIPTTPSALSIEATKNETTCSQSTVPNQLEAGRSGVKVTLQSPLRVSQLRNAFQRRISSDFRSSSHRLNRQMLNHVLIEDTNSELPQLISLKRLCNDFRMSCLQQSLEQRQKSMDWITTSFDQSSGIDEIPSQCESVDISANNNEVVLKHEIRATCSAHSHVASPSSDLSAVEQVPSEDCERLRIEQTYLDESSFYVNMDDECTRL